MTHCVWLLIAAAFVCVDAGDEKPIQAHGVTDVDIKHADGSASYCSGGKCTVKAGVTVKITFTLTVEADKPISQRPWTAKIGNSQNKYVFENWNACAAGSEIVLQAAACGGGSNVAAGQHPGHAVAVIADKATRGHLILGNSSPYVSGYLDVTVTA